MNCKRCGSDKTVSAGMRIRCTKCKKTAAKIPRREVILACDRPNCPECGASSPYSERAGSDGRGRRWTCRECGRSYKDELGCRVQSSEVQIE